MTTKRLLAEIDYPGWRPRNWLNVRKHWGARLRNEKPPLELVIFRSADALVVAPHAIRTVQLTRFSPQTLDDDGLASSLKPALDILKTITAGVVGADVTVPGLIYDDSPKFAKIIWCQSKRPFKEYTVAEAKRPHAVLSKKSRPLRYGVNVKVFA